MPPAAPLPDDAEIRTRPTLLAGLGNRNNKDAWLRFYEMYQRVILAMAARWGLTEACGRDVLQDVMLAVSQAAPSFTYDRERRVFHARGGEGQVVDGRHGNFRQWLFTIVNRTIWKYRYSPRRSREISFGDVREPGDQDRLRAHFDGNPHAQGAPDALLLEKNDQDYRLALLEQAIRMLPECTKRSHPRKIAIFLVLKQPHVFAYLARMSAPPLPSPHMAEITALAQLGQTLGRELTKLDLMAYYRISSNHVDQEVKAIKTRLADIVADLRAGRDPRQA